MSRMETFKITVDLLSPVIISKDTFWTLDAVCFGILSDMRDVGLSEVDPIEGVPLKCEDGLFFASRAFFKNEVPQDLTKIGGIRPVKDMENALAMFTTPRKVMPKIVTTRDDYKLHLSRYIEMAAPSVSWIAVGEPEKVVALIRNAGSIGALRKEGFGRVGNVDYDVDETLNPLVENGMPLRPIPSTHALSKGVDQSAPMAADAWKPPYFFASNQASCFVPV